MTRPTKITPDPIIDAVVELRFDSSVPADAILGMLFAHVKPKYKDFKKLPVADFPEEIRVKDRNLQFQPYYQCEVDSYRLNVGPRVISLANTGSYAGWKEKYYPELKEVLGSLEKSGIVDNFTRLGIRYIDFFELNIYDHINLSISLKNEPLDALQQTFNAVFKNGDYLTRLQVVNNINVNVNNVEKSGSVVDTDTYVERSEGFSFNDTDKMMDQCHELSVNFFFDLLKQEFIDSLNPEYVK